MLNNRQIALIKTIKLYPHFETLSFYSTKIGISERTLSRDIAQLNKYFFKPPIQILSKRGIGVALNATSSEYIELLNQLNLRAEKGKVLSNKIRPYYILLMLLFNGNEFISQNELAQIFFVSKSVINSDINKIEHFIENAPITLEKSRKGTAIKAAAYDLRDLMVETLVQIHMAERDNNYSITYYDLIPRYWLLYFKNQITNDMKLLIERLVYLVDSITLHTSSIEDQRKLYYGLLVLISEYQSSAGTVNDCDLELNEQYVQIGSGSLVPIAEYLNFSRMYNGTS